MLKFIRRELNLGLALLGFLVAALSAGIGIGGGAIFVPLLMSVFRFDFKKAARTSLAAIIPISLVGAVSHLVLLSPLPPLRYYLMFIPMCILGTILGGRIAQKRKDRWLKFAFSLFLIIVSLKILEIFDFPRLFFSSLYEILLANETLVLIIFGVTIGFIAIHLGIGCGLLIVPFYVIVMKLDMRQAISISLTSMFFLTFSATLIHRRLKTLDFTPLKSLLGPALIGAVLGALISSHLPASLLRQLFGVFLLVIAGKYSLQELWAYYRSLKPSLSYKSN
ncbi:MAG: hypothetical protein AMJ79_11115 [Phycisphaerae bacterium SM23_30]|nr:MAG: hypothetical protein AMJ79_11115 [Phycisphaerae bacterium SM23_30]